MAAPIVKFNTYTFPNKLSFDPHFTRLRLGSHRFNGAIGGAFDDFGSGVAPTEDHTLALSFMLTVTDRDNLQAAIDDVTALADLGRTTLFYTPPGESERFCYARVADMDIPQDFSSAQLWLPVRIRFAVTEPRWYRNATTSAVQACTGTLTEWTVTYANGHADAIPISIKIAVAAGKSITDPILRRRIDGVLYDEVSYSGTIPASTTLWIYCQSMSVALNTTDAYSGFDFLHPDWFRLEPGANTLQLLADNAGDEATVTINYRETYR